MKHKIGIKEYAWSCGDGCCDEFGHEWYLDGEMIHKSPCYDNGLMAVMQKLGIDVEVVGLDENNQEIWTL